MADVFCIKCGHRNELGANFCSSCGEGLEGAGAEPTTVTFHPDDPALEGGEPDVTVDPTDVPTGVGALVVKRGPNAGSRYVLDQALTTAGRHPESDIFLDDITVSRRHVEVALSESGYLVRDVGSLNGTYLNRQRIEQATLTNGDELQIGTFRLVFVTGSE